LTDFTEIILEHASSILTLTNVTFTGLGTNNKGRFEMITSAAVANLTGCGFVNFGDSVLGTGATFATCNWINAEVIQANGGDLTGSQVLTPNVAADEAGLVWNVNTDPNGLLDDMTFSKTSGTAHHAIEFGTSIPTTNITLTNIAFGTDFSASENTSPTAEAGDETFAFRDTTGTLTVNLVGCSGNFGFYSAGVVVTIVADPVQTGITVNDTDGDPISGARVLLEAEDGSGPLPFEESVTIVQTGGTATVTHAAHGIPDGTQVVIRGVAENEYNKVAVISVVDAGEYTYAVDSGAASPATGTPIASGVMIHGTTNGSGFISDSRTLSGDQPFKGSIRDSSGSPFHVAASITGITDSVTGFSATVALQSDE
jgi:hypothetical protein